MRSFVPFGDPWTMPIPLPYSLVVRDQNNAWTCGQVPLDTQSNVIKPGDLLGQTDIVCDYIERLLKKSDMEVGDLGKLVLYFVESKSDDAERMIQRCRTRFGDVPVIIPIAVPHFYFDGLLIEVDAFAGKSSDNSIVRSLGKSAVKITGGGDLAWVTLTTDPSAIAECRGLLESTLREFGLADDHRLSEHWAAPRSLPHGQTLSELAHILEGMGLLMDWGTLVESSGSSTSLVGEMTFVKHSAAPVAADSVVVDGVKVTRRRIGRFGWFGARSLDPELRLVEQTTRLVSALAEALNRDGMDFGSVVKSTSHYVGGSTADELFDNMKIRNSRYQVPGPASTGLPVLRLADGSSRIAVDLVAIENR